MSNVGSVFGADQDAIYVLPLSSMPLKTQGLRRARLVKNSRLEGMVELFSGSGSGSGQVAPTGLYSVFDFGQEPHPDVELVQKLSELPSFDVYSLRIQLRRMGIEVEDAASLTLSGEQTAQLSAYMQAFLKPLVAQVYGGAQVEAVDFNDLVNLFRSPNIASARDNLIQLSSDLGIEVLEIPEFIQDYGDAYLSLSYYQFCFDNVQPVLEEFYDAVDEILLAPHIQQNLNVTKNCSNIRKKLATAQSDVSVVLDMFKTRTEDMWQSISAAKFERMKSLVSEYLVNIGGALCIITVKMIAWKKAFPHADAGSIAKRIDLLTSEIAPGLDTLQAIKYTDAG